MFSHDFLQIQVLVDDHFLLRRIFNMKLLNLNVLLAVIIFCCLIGAEHVVDDNDDLRETMRSLQVLNFSS